MGLIFYENFQDVASVLPYPHNNMWLPEKNDATQVPNGRNGDAVRFTQNVTTHVNAERSEWAIGNVGRFNWFQDYRVGFSTKIVNPVSYWHSMMQFHAIPNNSDWSRSASSNSLVIQTNGLGDMTYGTATDVTKLGGTNSGAFSDLVDTSTSVTPNEWVDTVMFFQLSDTNTGYFTIYQNGIKVLDVQNQSTVYPLDGGGLRKHEQDYLKIGLYGSYPWTGEVHYDELRIWEGADGLYHDVSPLGLMLNGSTPIVANQSTGILSRK